MKQLPKRSGEHLFDVIMRRHELRSTMMTSNRPLDSTLIQAPKLSKDWGPPLTTRLFRILTCRKNS